MSVDDYHPPANPATEAFNGVVARYVAVSGLVVLLYDHILTMKEEIQLVWPGPSSLPKVLYYINRYLVLGFMLFKNYQLAPFRPPLSDSFCRTQLLVVVVVHVITKTAGIALICLRVGALYHGRRWVTRVLWASFILFYVLRWGVTIAGAVPIFRAFKYSPITNACFADQTNAILLGIFLWAVPLAFDILLVALTSSKAYQNAVLLNKSFRSPVLYTLFRDGIMYFIIIATLRAFGSVAWIILSPALLEAATDIEWCLEAILISRFFINLRLVNNRGHTTVYSQTRTAFALDNISSLHFVPRRRQRVGTTPDINADTSRERRALGRVVSIGSQSRGDKPPALYGETLELKVREGAGYDTTAEGGC